MALLNFSIELIINTLSYLEKDEDIINFSLVCRRFRDIIHEPRIGIWRDQWRQHFDVPPGISGLRSKLIYQNRRQILNRLPPFTFGRKPSEKRVLRVIRDLIIESFVDVSPTTVEPVSKNLEYLQYFTRKSNIIETLYSWKHRERMEPLLQTIQLLLMNWSLDYHMIHKAKGFALSQYHVYDDPKRNPVFLNTDKSKINISFLLHIVNFFTHHLTREDQYTLFNAFKSLKPENKPQAWQEQLRQGTYELGNSWVGMDANLPCHRDYHTLRATKPGDTFFEDSLGANEGSFRILEIDFTRSDKPHWPEAFNNYLNSYPGPPANHDYLQFTGTGHGSDFLNLSGVIHAVASQHDIPGWQRITFMTKTAIPKPPSDDSDATADSSSTQVDDASGNGFTLFSEGNNEDRLVNEKCWAHEGLVLPGGMIMLGRWWSPIDETGEDLETGPWMYWKRSDRVGCDEDEDED